MIRHLKGLLHPVMCAVVPMMCAMSAANEVIFRKRATNHRAILRKITSKDKASYGSSPIGCLWANPVMCSVVQMRCVMRSSARWSINYIQMSTEQTKEKK